jgi:aminoglycoside 6'-N-acetyltransferase I
VLSTTEKTGLRICSLVPENEARLKEAARILYEGFNECWPGSYPNLESAMEEVRASLGEGRISRVAVTPGGELWGWISAAVQYKGHVWELHPLVVKEQFRRQGIGRALVEDLARQVKERGGLTIWLGTDDETNMTSLGGVELFPGVLDHLTNIQNLHEHPFGFYQKVGFEIIGVMPDANGLGKPDIYMGMPVR